MAVGRMIGGAGGVSGYEILAEVIADGVKELATILAEMYAQTDLNKVNGNTKFIIDDGSGNKYICSLVYFSIPSSIMRFSYVQTVTTASKIVDVQTIDVRNTSSSSKFLKTDFDNSGSSLVVTQDNRSSIVPTSGATYRIVNYY